jgi:hypothetical protein
MAGEVTGVVNRFGFHESPADTLNRLPGALSSRHHHVEWSDYLSDASIPGAGQGLQHAFGELGELIVRKSECAGDQGKSVAVR